MTTIADILVIGGGIAGISAAAELAREAQVVVLEREDQLGYHATGRSAAIYIRNYGNSTLRALNALSFAPLAGALLGESVLSPRGELLVANTDEMDAFEGYLESAKDIERLTPREAQDLVPVLRPDRLAAAAIEREAQDIDVDRLLQGCAQMLRNRRGRIHTGCPVHAITRGAGVWQVETAKGELFEAPILVNAAGAWADQVAGLAGIDPIGLQPMRRSAVIMSLPSNVTGHQNWPLFGSVAETWYAKPDPAGLMISPADEDPVAPQDAWPDDMVIAEGLFRFSEMVDVPIKRPTHSWAGLRSFVADRTPVVGFAPEHQGFFWLAGQGGYGVQTAPALAQITLDLCVRGGKDTDQALEDALSPARLHDSAR